MPLFKKKPVVIEAEHFTDENKNRAYNFVRCTTAPDFEDGKPVLKIQTLEGVMTARLGDWIIKGVSGEFYPCKPDIFAKTYEPTDLPANVPISYSDLERENAKRSDDAARLDWLDAHCEVVVLTSCAGSDLFGHNAFLNPETAGKLRDRIDETRVTYPAPSKP